MTAVISIPKKLTRFVLSGVIAASCTAALAQTPPAPLTPPPTGMRAPDAMRDSAAAPMDGYHGKGHMDPANMQAMMAKRQADMKAKLKITPVQESAWTAFTSAMQPPAGRMGWYQSPEQRAEVAKLTTPERIDKMRALRAQRSSEMNAITDKRDDATKIFYAALSAEQKAVFDAELANRSHHPMHH